MSEEESPHLGVWARASRWWARRGNAMLPRWYFHPLATLAFAFSIIFFYGAVISGIILTTVQHLLTYGLDLVIFIFLAFIITLFLILFLVLLYMQKRTAYTFKNEPTTRTIILQRDRWKSLSIFSFLFFFMFAYYLTLTFALLKWYLPKALGHLQILSDALAFLTSIFPDYFTLSCTLAILSFLFIFFLQARLDRREKLILIADSLKNLIEPQQPKEYKRWKEDAECLAGEFVRTFGKLVLYTHRDIKEVDLGPHLSPILLSLFWGNTEEKTETKEMLSELQERLKEDELKRQVNIVDWLSKVENSFPRLAELRDAMKLKTKVRKGVLSTTPESLKYIAAIATMVSTMVAVISLILLLLRP